MKKRLYRSRSDRMLTGVCGGLAQYFDLDSTLVRLATVILMLVTNGLGVVVYIVFALIIPLEPAAPHESATALETTPSTAMPELAGARDSVEQIVDQAQVDIERPS